MLSYRDIQLKDHVICVNGVLIGVVAEVIGVRPENSRFATHILVKPNYEMMEVGRLTKRSIRTYEYRYKFDTRWRSVKWWNRVLYAPKKRKKYGIF